ncbi:hypothetical protein CRYPD_987 [uncultured Candidatus Thioglobus sp.]|nr:hypothetical protein CRYPD_987 [uncultured Candidatus Thioglobus sp.]
MNFANHPYLCKGLIEDELLKNGANYIKFSEWSNHVEIDDNIITG